MAEQPYPRFIPSWAKPLFGGSYAGIIYRVDAPGRLRRVQECDHAHRHPAQARACAEQVIADMTARCPSCGSPQGDNGGCINADCGRWEGPSYVPAD